MPTCGDFHGLEWRFFWDEDIERALKRMRDHQGDQLKRWQLDASNTIRSRAHVRRCLRRDLLPGLTSEMKLMPIYCLWVGHMNSLAEYNRDTEGDQSEGVRRIHPFPLWRSPSFSALFHHRVTCRPTDLPRQYAYDIGMLWIVGVGASPRVPKLLTQVHVAVRSQM